MVTFSNDNIYFNETTTDFTTIGKIFPETFGALPMYRFQYKGQILKINDYDEFSKHVNPVWKQVRFSHKSNKIIEEELHEPLMCDEEYLAGVQNHYKGIGTL